jgi:uncharacterized protein (TIGR02284 family)
MATANDNIVHVLNNLIETCKDGEEGFRQAAEKAKEPSLRSLFGKYSTQRAGYVQELQQLVTSLGESPATSGHATATLHRGWIGLKSALSKNEDRALIEECEAGEDAAVKAYQEAIAQNLPPSLSDVIRRQFTGIQQAHAIVRDLKHGKAISQTV